DSRAENYGRLAEAMRNSDRSHAVHGRVLDPGVRPSGAGGFGSLPGERAGDEESAGAQKRCAREPMADEVAHLWAVAEFVPAVATDPQDADVLAAAQGSGRERGPTHST